MDREVAAFELGRPVRLRRVHARCSGGSSSGRAVAPASRDRMPASITKPVLGGVERPAHRLVEPAHDLELGRAQRDVADDLVLAGPAGGRSAAAAKRVRRAVPGVPRGGTVSPAGSARPAPPRPRCRPRGGGRGASGRTRPRSGARPPVPALTPRSPPRWCAAVDDRLLPGRHQRPRHVARTDHDVHPVARERTHQPARLARSRQGQLLLGDDHGRTVVGVDEVDQPAQRPGGLAALLAAHTLAEQVVGREALGTVAPPGRAPPRRRAAPPWPRGRPGSWSSLSCRDPRGGRRPA